MEEWKDGKLYAFIFLNLVSGNQGQEKPHLSDTQVEFSSLK